MALPVPPAVTWRRGRFGRWLHVLVATFVLVPVSSIPALAASQWQTSTVKQVYPLADGTFVVVLDEDPPTCAAPGPGKYLYVTTGQNGVTEEGRKQFVAALLQAVATRAAVSINFDDATPYCYINRLVLNPP